MSVGEPIPIFPSKTIFKMNSKDRKIRLRAFKLLYYIQFHLKYGGHNIPAIIDSLSAFLQVCHGLNVYLCPQASPHVNACRFLTIFINWMEMDHLIRLKLVLLTCRRQVVITVYDYI